MAYVGSISIYFCPTALCDIMATIYWMQALIPATLNDGGPSYPKAIKKIDSNKIVFQTQGTLSGSLSLQSQSSRGCNWGWGRSIPAWSAHQDQTASKSQNQTNGLYSFSYLRLNSFQMVRTDPVCNDHVKLFLILTATLLWFKMR